MKASQRSWKITRAKREFGWRCDNSSPYSSRMARRNNDNGETTLDIK
jgi:hypothetical protein